MSQTGPQSHLNWEGGGDDLGDATQTMYLGN